MRFVGLKWKRANILAGEASFSNERLFYEKKFSEWNPMMVFAKDERTPKTDLVKIPLWNSHMSIVAGDKFCAGRSYGSFYYKCDKRPAAGEIRCKTCSLSDEWFACVKCRGECINQKKRAGCETTPYILYLAAFGERVKIGVSNQFRFFERILEQGADFAVKIMEIKDGGYARKLEQDISKKLKITDRVRSEYKIKNFISDPNSSIASISQAILEITEAGHDVDAARVYDMRENYRLSNITGKINDRLKLLSKGQYTTPETLFAVGSVASMKGSISIMKSGSEYFPLNFKDIIGRDVHMKISHKASPIATAESSMSSEISLNNWSTPTSF